MLSDQFLGFLLSHFESLNIFLNFCKFLSILVNFCLLFCRESFFLNSYLLKQDSLVSKQLSDFFNLLLGIVNFIFRMSNCILNFCVYFILEFVHLLIFCIVLLFHSIAAFQYLILLHLELKHSFHSLLFSCISGYYRLLLLFFFK